MAELKNAPKPVPGTVRFHYAKGTPSKTPPRSVAVPSIPRQEDIERLRKQGLLSDKPLIHQPFRRLPPMPPPENGK